MTRIGQVDPTQAKGEAKRLLDGVQERLGMTPNMMKVMAASPAALNGYLSLGVALSGGTLSAMFREQIALAVAQANLSEYYLSRHTEIAKKMGMSDNEITASREARSDDGKCDVGLKFVSQLVILRGRVGDLAVQRLRAAGFCDAEIAEIVANVALCIFANYFNDAAGTEPDFPKVSVELGL